MKKKICIGFVVLAMLLSSLGLVTSAADTQEIVILFESDVHCSVGGYAKIAALKDEISDDAEYVGVVTSGDFVQGGSLCIVSKGEYIINIMNLFAVFDFIYFARKRFFICDDHIKFAHAELQLEYLLLRTCHLSFQKDDFFQHASLNLA